MILRTRLVAAMALFVIVIGATLALGTTDVFGAIPDSINFQGILKNSGGTPVPDGSYSVTFRIYDASNGGTPLWSEAQSISTSSGLFTVLLGSVTPLPDSVLSAPNRFVSIQVSPDAEMAQRIPLTSVAYAERVGTMDGAIGGTLEGPLVIGDTTAPLVAEQEATHCVGPANLVAGKVRVTNWLQLASLPLDNTATNVVVFDPTTGCLHRSTAFSQAADPADDWVRNPPAGVNMSPIPGVTNVGIGTTTPSTWLQVVKQMSVTSDEAVQVDFGNTVGSIGTTGITVTGTPLNAKGGQTGVIASVSLPSAPDHTQRGSAEGRLASQSGFDAQGVFLGVLGSATPIALNNGGGVSRGLGGYFSTGSSTAITLNGVGTYWVGGTSGELNGVFNGSPGLGAVAGVIGVDNNTGTAPSWAGYFQGRGYFRDNVGIGTTTPAYKLDVCGDVHVGGDLYVSGATFFPGGPLCPSDSRFKKNVTEVVGALGLVTRLRGVRYDWDREHFPDRNFSDARQLGFIAQEVKDVVPELVTKMADGYYAVDYARLAPVLVEAIKELKLKTDRIKELEEKTDQIAALETKVNELQALVDKLAIQGQHGVTTSQVDHATQPK